MLMSSSIHNAHKPYAPNAVKSFSAKRAPKKERGGRRARGLPAARAKVNHKLRRSISPMQRVSRVGEDIKSAWNFFELFGPGFYDISGPDLAGCEKQPNKMVVFHYDLDFIMIWPYHNGQIIMAKS